MRWTFLMFSKNGKSLWYFVHTISYSVGAGVSTCMSISDTLVPYIFRRKFEKTRPMSDETDGEVFISRQSCCFLFIDKIIEVLFPICTLTWRVNNYVSSQGKWNKQENWRFSYIRSPVITLYFSWESILMLVIISKSDISLNCQVWLKCRNKSVFTTAEHFPFQN